MGTPIGSSAQHGLISARAASLTASSAAGGTQRCGTRRQQPRYSKAKLEILLAPIREFIICTSVSTSVGNGSLTHLLS